MNVQTDEFMKKKKIGFKRPFEQDIDESTLSLECAANDFDPYIKFGRDDKLFVKREALDQLKQETHFTEEELKNLKTLYCNFAEV